MVARDAIVAQYGGARYCLPAMMGNGIKDDTVLHGWWRSRSFTMEKIVVDFKYALFTRSQLGSTNKL
jgi:hypothetical protein